MSSRAPLLIKVGGGESINLAGIADDIAALARPTIILHGANVLRDDLAERLGHPIPRVTSISGISSTVTDDGALDILLAAYSGIRNKRLVEMLRQRGVNAMGLSGLDGGLIEGRRGKGIRVMENGRKRIIRDHSGRPTKVNAPLLRLLLGEGLTPVLTVPIGDEAGRAINTENDDVLALIAPALGVETVLMLIEEEGLLTDSSDPGSAIDTLSPEGLGELEAEASGRFRRKLRALGTLFEGCPGTLKVVLADGRVDRPVHSALVGNGTVITAEADDAADDGATGADTSPEPDPSRPENDIADVMSAHEIDVYGKRGVELVSGQGATVTDASGRTYVDCVGGHGALVLGHNPPAFQAVFRRAAETTAMTLGCPGSFFTRSKADYVQALTQRLPDSLSRVFLCNSGTEAVEAALKFARGSTGRSGLVAVQGGFHGRTMGALALTSRAEFREPFAPMMGGVAHAPFNDLDALRGLVDETTAAVFLEVIQGEGGVNIAEDAYLSGVRELCTETGALLVFDEVQTGFGRTGSLFAFEQSGVVPDLLCLAKGIASGFPMGAVVGSPDLSMPVSSHGSTFAGSPLACSLALATLKELDELVGTVEEKGRRLESFITQLDSRGVKGVRRRGLMIGIELRTRSAPVVGGLQEAGVLALTAGRRVLRLLPPLTISDDEMSRLESALASVF